MGTLYRLNWQEIKAEYMASELPLIAMKAKHCPEMSRQQWYRHTGHWRQDRDGIRQVSYKSAEKRIIEDKARKYANYSKLLKGIQAQVISIFKRYTDENGNMKPMEPSQVKALSETIVGALKGDRLIEGDTTDNVKTDGANNFHMQVLNIVEAVEKGRPLNEIITQ